MCHHVLKRCLLFMGRAGKGGGVEGLRHCSSRRHGHGFLLGHMRARSISLLKHTTRTSTAHAFLYKDCPRSMHRRCMLHPALPTYTPVYTICPSRSLPTSLSSSSPSYLMRNLTSPPAYTCITSAGYQPSMSFQCPITRMPTTTSSTNGIRS